jgi:hypothetical protein
MKFRFFNQIFDSKDVDLKKKLDQVKQKKDKQTGNQGKK